MVKASHDRWKYNLLEATLRSPMKIMGHRQFHYGTMVTLYGNYGSTNHWENFPCHQGSAHTVDAFGLTVLLCLIIAGQLFQVPPPQENISDFLGLAAKGLCSPM